MQKGELGKVLAAHLHWALKDCPGWEGMRASLSFACLKGADLPGVFLRGADLSNANLREADLSGADLRGADLHDAALRGVNMRHADLRGADLSGANLADADLRGADLGGANMKGANMPFVNLSGTDLRGATLWGVKLPYANLTDADLRGADLRSASLFGTDVQGADLTDARLEDAGLAYANLTGTKMPDIPMACPETGSFIGYKKAGGCIVVLKIPEDAERSSAATAKCRCSKAEVIAIQNLDGSDAGIEEVRSDYDANFVYRVGRTVSVEKFNRNRWHVCAGGIHFYVNRKDAVNY